MSIFTKVARGSELSCGLGRIGRTAAAGPCQPLARTRFLAACREVGVYQRRPLLPKMDARELVPDDLVVRLRQCATAAWQVTTAELATLVGVAAARQARDVFEIGTFDGRTTLNFFLNLPEARITTLDLPPERQRLPDGKVAGSLIRVQVEAGEIEQIHGDSLEIDADARCGGQDFVFIDAGHSYRNAISDSWLALRMIEGRQGTIVWHDYAEWPGVTWAVEEVGGLVSSRVRFGWVRETTLAVMITEPGEPLRLRTGNMEQS